MFLTSHCLNACALSYCQYAGACSDEYHSWFTTFSHPFVVNDRDLIRTLGPDATVGEHGAARFSEKASVLFDSLVEHLRQQFNRLRLGIYEFRREVKEFKTVVGIRRPMP